MLTGTEDRNGSDRGERNVTVLRALSIRRLASSSLVKVCVSTLYRLAQ